MEAKTWQRNLTEIEEGIFRTMNGNADEMIAIGRVIKAGFPCSRVDVTNAKYDAVVDTGGTKRLLRIQIKGSGGPSFSFIGGYRSGKQIDRKAKSRAYKYTSKDCDLIIGINTNNGECYIIPIADIEEWDSNTKSMNLLQDYKENWQILIDMAKDKD